MDDIFHGAFDNWTPVSPSLATVHRIIGLLMAGVIVVVSTAVTGFVAWAGSIFWTLLPAAGIASGFALGLWVWWWAPRNQRSWGYLEQEDDLLVKGGVMFRRIVVVPYGRMQFVDVQSGPLARSFGFASITLHTASTATAATIPGVPIEEANRLRDRLTELGESHGAGV